MFSSFADFSRRSSYDVGDGCRESEVFILKDRRLVPMEPVREGMLRFSFLLETCTPGSVPDPQLVAAVLDLVRRLTLLFWDEANRGGFYILWFKCLRFSIL